MSSWQCTRGETVDAAASEAAALAAWRFKSSRVHQSCLRAVMPEACFQHDTPTLRAELAKAGVARSSRAETANKGRLRWSGRQPVLKTGGHRKVWRSNRQPSAKQGAGDPCDCPHRPSRTDTQAATRPDCRSGAYVLRRFESCSVHQSWKLGRPELNGRAARCHRADAGSIPVGRTTFNSAWEANLVKSAALKPRRGGLETYPRHHHAIRGGQTHLAIAPLHAEARGSGPL
jgi:hypothetical protein